MIRISKVRSIEYKNGYFICREYSVTSDKSKTPGVECVSNKQTYPTLSPCWSALKEAGEDGNEIMKAANKLLKDNQIKVSTTYLLAKQAKLDKDILK